MHIQAIKDLNMKVITINYPDTLPIGIGFEVNGTIFNLKNLQEIMEQLKVYGFHYRNFTFSYQGQQYIVAQLYIGDRLAIQSIPQKEDATQEQINDVYRFMLDMDSLGIDPKYREIYQEPAPKPIQEAPAPSPQSAVTETKEMEIVVDDEIDNIMKDMVTYLTQSEIESYGDIEELDEDEYEELEELIKSKKAIIASQELIEYKLPTELAYYKGVYENSFMNILVQDPDSEEEAKSRLNRSLEMVVRGMMTVPQIRTVGAGRSEKLSYPNMEEMMMFILRETGIVADGKGTGGIGFASTMIESTAEHTKASIIAKYGSYQAFVEEIPNIADGTAVTEAWVVTNGLETFNVYAMLRKDPYKEVIIDFARYEGNEVHIFPAALYNFLVSIGLPAGGEFNGLFNTMIKDYFLDCDLDVDDVSLHLEQPDIKMLEMKELEYLGIYKDTTDLYIFRNLEDQKLSMVFPNSIGNLMFGAYMSLNGEFKINYIGKDIVVEATKPTLSDFEMENAITEALDSYDSQGASMMQHLYPQYEDYYGLDIKDVSEIHKEMFLNYETELQKAITSGELRNLDQTLVGSVTPPNQQNVFEAPEEGAVDLFANQPAPVVETKPQPTQVIHQAPVNTIEVKPIPVIQTAEQVEADPNPYDSSIYPGNVAQAYSMIMGGMRQEDLGMFKTEFTNLINKYKNQ